MGSPAEQISDLLVRAVGATLPRSGATGRVIVAIQKMSSCADTTLYRSNLTQALIPAKAKETSCITMISKVEMVVHEASILGHFCLSFHGAKMTLILRRLNRTLRLKGNV